jgi:hypothetical protein
MVMRLNVLRRPILSAMPAHTRRPTRLLADSSSTNDDAKDAVTIVGSVDENISLIIGFATAKMPCGAQCTRTAHAAAKMDSGDSGL